MRIWDYFKSLRKKTKETPKEEHRFILCIDGGGIRGIIPSIILQEYGKILEETVTKPFWSHFDLIAGTSTGGLLTAALSFDSSLPQKEIGNQKQLDMTCLENIYNDYRGEIFPQPKSKTTRPLKFLSQIVNSKYSEKPLENLLKKWFGDLKMKDSKVPVLIVGYNVTEGSPYIMTNRSYPDLHVWEACRATSAAPTFFSPQKIGNDFIVDGGVIANNPVLYAYKEAKELYPECTHFHILSLSTAGSVYKMEYNESNGLVSWIEPIQKIYATSQKQVAEDLITTFDNVEYIRIHKDLNHPIKMDNISNNAIAELKKLGKETFIENKQKIEDFAKLQGAYKNASTPS